MEYIAGGRRPTKKRAMLKKKEKKTKINYLSRSFSKNPKRRESNYTSDPAAKQMSESVIFDM